MMGALPPAARYSIAVLLAVLAQLARIPLHSPTVIPFITYAPFILLSAYQGGWGPGVLTTILCSTESLYFAVAPVLTFQVDDTYNWVGMGSLVLMGVVASALFERLRRVQQVADKAERERSEMERELAARRRVLESIIEHSPVSIALLRGRDFRFEMVNPAYQSLAPGEPMTGRTVAEVWPEAKAIILPLLEEVRDTRAVHHMAGLAIPRHRGRGMPVEERYFDMSYVPLPYAGPSDGEDSQLLAVVKEVTEEHRAQETVRGTLCELEAAVGEKTVLLKEVHHRVKNNLAVIASLLNMKAGAMEGDEAREALEDSQRRVRSIALIHEHLSGTEHLDRIDFAEYAGQLLQELGSVYDDAERRIRIRVEAERIEMGIHRAIPCALILNELVTNALKHAFPDGRRGEVVVGLRLATAEQLELWVEDNGVGCPQVVPARSAKSLGLRIVEILTRQLEGSLDRADCAGTRFVLRFGAGTSSRIAK
jgi:two-component sensor histidine kinase